MDELNENPANVWLGAETGLLKSVDLVKKVATNHFSKENYGKEQEIRCMCWDYENKCILLTGHKNGVIREFDIKKKSFSNCYKMPDFELGKDHFISMHKTDQHVITCMRDGHIKLWNPKTDEVTVSILAGDNVQCMAYHDNKQLIAAGGKENCLKLWDINAAEKPIFRAKNVKPNWLQLRIPIDVLNIKFVPQSGKVLTTTGEHNIRIYDPQTETRRPVLETEFGEYPLTAVDMCERNSNQVVVGNTRGEAASFDCRKFKHPIRCYKGFAGSIRGIVCHETLPYFFSCGLDRFLYVHNEKHSKLVQKVYLKSRLNCLLATDSNVEDKSNSNANVKRQIKKTEEEIDDDILWNQMETITEKDRCNLPESKDNDEPIKIATKKDYNKVYKKRRRF